MLTIDMASIRHNLSIISCKVNHSALIAGVIKSNAYGMGYSSIAEELYLNGCRHFFVASIDEAIAARHALPNDSAIYVLGGTLPGTEHQYLEFNLTPVIVSYQSLCYWNDFLKAREVSFPIAIKLNTGMNRLGLDSQDVSEICFNKDQFDGLSIKLVMSHLACADDPSSPMNQVQLSKFIELSNRIKTYFSVELRSLANSSGIFLGPEYHFDMVRPGAAIYGINPQPKASNPLKNAINFKLPIRSVRRIQEIGTVGYGATAQILAGSTLAVVGAGYSDGIHSAFGRAFDGRYKGVSVPTCGRISMDLTTFDISAVTAAIDPFVDEEYIDVIDHTYTLDYWMKKTGSLGYEILTSFGERIERRYVNQLEINND